MGTYATTTSITPAMVGVTFDTATTSLLTTMITRAEAEVNKYLSRRYDLGSAYFQTTTSIPPLVRSLTETLAEGWSWIRIARGDKEMIKAGQGIIKDALENLKMIAEGKSDVTDTLGSLLPEASTGAFRIQCNTTDYAPTFNEDDPLSWQTDPDKLLEIEDGRG